MSKRSAIFALRCLSIFAVFACLPARPAWAVAFEFQIESPSITAIRKSLEDRFTTLGEYFDNGVVGLTWEGNVALREAEGMQLEVRKLVEALVADENKDRLTLIREIARANGRPDWEENLRATFAQRWIQRAPPGWYYRDSNRHWVRKSAPVTTTSPDSAR